MNYYVNFTLALSLCLSILVLSLVPYFIHKTDLLQLAPRWLEKCRELRQDTQVKHQHRIVDLLHLPCVDNFF